MSSFKQKKSKTLATRKRTRKRKADTGTTHEDESGRLFQPPSRRDPRWKKPDVSEVIGGVMQAKKKQRLALLTGEDVDDEDDDEEDDGLPEMVTPIESDDEHETIEEEDNVESPSETEDAPKTPLKLLKSLEDCVASAVKAHQSIRRKDTRQKAKVLILADAPSIIKALKAALNVKGIAARSKGKHGVRSSGDKALVLSYKNVAPLKTPMEKFKESNEDVLKDFKIGKVPTLLAEETSFYPFSDLSLGHVIFVAKAAQSAINLDQTLFDGVELRSFVINEKGTKLSTEDRERLTKSFLVTEA